MEIILEKCGQTAVVKSFGAELVSYKKNSKEFIWGGNPEYWRDSNPHLFPVVCSLKDNKAIIEGQEFTIPKHGFAKNSEFEIFSQTKDAVTLLLKQNADTKKVYPYNFSLYITHCLLDDGFKTTYKVCNTDNKSIYFCLGGHTGFNCPQNENELFSDYDILFNKLETNPVYQSTPDDIGGLIHKEGMQEKFINIDKISLNYDIFKLDAVVFSKINSNHLKLMNRNTNKGIEFAFEGFKSLGIWTATKGGGSYICLEPWTVIPDFDDATGVFTDKPNITELQINEQKEYSYIAKAF